MGAFLEGGSFWGHNCPPPPKKKCPLKNARLQKFCQIHRTFYPCRIFWHKFFLLNKETRKKYKVVNYYSVQFNMFILTQICSNKRTTLSLRWLRKQMYCHLSFYLCHIGTLLDLQLFWKNTHQQKKKQCLKENQHPQPSLSSLSSSPGGSSRKPY